MEARFVIHCESADGVEQVWLCDDVQGEKGEDLALYRSGKHALTLGPDDYARSLVIEPLDGAKKH